MEKTNRPNNKHLESNDEANNREVFEKMLKVFSPELHYVYNCLEKNMISPEDIAEITHKIVVVKRLDDGYGKVLVEIRKKDVFGIKILQSKIIKPLKDETEFD